MKRIIQRCFSLSGVIWLLVGLLFMQTSCTTLSRIKRYNFTHNDIPTQFNGYRIAFISDLHYKSLFKARGLHHLVKKLNSLHADALLMGGDYQEGCQYVEELFSALSTVKTTNGIYGVLGNNDYERCHDEIINTMQIYGMHPLEQQTDTLRKDSSFILLTGIRNPFDLKSNGSCPTKDLSPNDFVILLVHTPDYAEEVPITNTDLVLAGHTHGGQVRIFGYAPIVPSRYGRRFLTGKKHNSKGTPIIITNGIGTSRINFRMSSPSEIVIITLHSKK